MKCTLNDVAKKAGVSIVTASRVINNVETVRASSREKVLKAMEELHYIPNTTARSLAKGKANVIGMIVPDIHDPFLMEVVRVVEQELIKNNYVLALGLSTDEDGNKIHGNYLFQPDRVDGMLLLTPLYEKEQVKVLQKMNIPFVILDNQEYPYHYPSVVVDNFKGGYEAGKYLYESGACQIAHIAGPENILAAHERYKGFSKALEEVGMEVFLMERGEFDIQTGYEVVTKWIHNQTIPDAIFAADDHIAFGVIDALKAYNLIPGKDVSVIGFDDHPFASRLHPYLTTFRQPVDSLGKKGVSLLLQVIKKALKTNIVIKLEPMLIERNSVKGKE